jgi:hypothetical protein
MLMATAMREAERQREYLADIQERFRLPQAMELSRFLAGPEHLALQSTLERITNDPSVAGMLAMLEQLQADTEPLRHAMEAVRTPWLDIGAQTRSLAGFAELHTIGRVLNDLPPFSPPAAEFLRAELGNVGSVLIR